MSLRFKRSVCIFALLFFYIKPSIAEVTFLDVIENPSDLKINLTKGFDKKTAINIANKNFIIKWGPDKVITNEKQ